MHKLASISAALLLSISCATLIAAEDEENKLSAETTDEIATSCEKQYSAETYPNDEERMALVDQCMDEKEDLAKQSRD